MAKQTTKWEAEIDPPSTHDTLEGAVAAELAAMLGWKAGSDSLLPKITREMVENADFIILCLNQLKGTAQC